MKRQQHRRGALRAALASLVAPALRGTVRSTTLPNTSSALSALGALSALTKASAAVAAPAPDATPLAEHPKRAWYLEARRMRELAESWGDQSYGAVVVAGGRVIGHGPSRVVKDGDPEAHAERVALREALAAQGGGTRLSGAVLYSTSRPCAACERAAARAGVLRMFHGEGLQDAGVPQTR